MAYFLKKTTTKKGIYLQIYESYRNKEKKETSHRSYKAIGYVQDLINKGICNPIEYYKNIVNEMNEQRKKEIKEARVKEIEESPIKNIGYFLIKSVFNTLDIKTHLELLAKIGGKTYDIYEVITSLVSARVVSPCSKLKTMNEVIPSFLETVSFTLDQLYDNILPFLGEEYERIIEIVNYAFNKKYSRRTKQVYFDGTNYYFEIDREKNDQRKGPSKENRMDPIISMGLLLDEEQIPLDMKIFPGNESEKPILREVITKMKEQNNIKGRTIQVADKWLNCTKNIIEAIKNGDGYIFSQSIKKLSSKEKQWALLDNQHNEWIDVRDNKGNLSFRYKFCIDEFPYKYVDENNKTITLKLTQKRIITYNPKLAEKKRMEISKMIDKAKELNNSQAKRREYGDVSKYVSFLPISNEGEILEDTVVKATINQDKVDEDLLLAGYNLLITSEINKSEREIYNIYHQLWKIEDTFRTLKSELEARPAYLQRQDSLYGHFLICYLSVFALRILEIKKFNNEVNIQEIISFIRNLQILKNGNSYVNLGSKSKIKNINDKLNLKLTNYFLTDKTIKDLLKFKL